MERSNFPCHSSSRPLVLASALAHGKTCDHHICICLQSRRRHNDISAKAHWRRTNRTDALRRDNFFCFCVIACMRLCMCVCVRAHLCVRACKDCLTPICVGNVICDLEEMELSLIDPLMLFFLRSSLPHLLQQEANTASRLPALKAQGKKKKDLCLFCSHTCSDGCAVLCVLLERRKVLKDITLEGKMLNNPFPPPEIFPWKH